MCGLQHLYMEDIPDENIQHGIFVSSNLFVRKSKPSISLLKRKVDEWQLDAKVQVYLSQKMKLLLLDYDTERYVLLKLPA